MKLTAYEKSMHAIVSSAANCLSRSLKKEKQSPVRSKALMLTNHLKKLASRKREQTMLLFQM